MSGPTRQRNDKPYAVLLYGVEGVGKTTLGLESESPVFMGNELGTGENEVDRFPPPKVFQDLKDQVQWLIDKPHSFKTLVFDSLDWAEPIIFSEVMKRENKGRTNIDLSHGGFDRGKIASTAIWDEWLKLITELRTRRKMAVIFIAHADAVRFKDPALQTDYQRYTIKLFRTSAAKFKEYVDAVLFGNYFASEDEDGKVSGKGSRFLFTAHRPGFDAKNRFGIPDRIDHRFSEFAKYASPEPLEETRARILSAMTALPEKRQKDLASALDRKGSDRGKLIEIEKAMRLEISQLSKEATV